MKKSNTDFLDDRFLTISILYLVSAVVYSLYLIVGLNDFRVFGSFWAAGDAWLKGSNPFAELPLTLRVNIPGADVIDNNLNPPIVLPLLALFSLIPMKQAAATWLFVSLAISLGSLAIATKFGGASKIKLAWALSCAALVDTLMLGQIYALLLLLGTGMHVGLRSDRPVLACLSLGLIIAFKPNFALALAFLCLSGHWRLAIRSAAIAGLLISLSILAFGQGLFIDWLEAVRADDHGIFPTTVSLISFFYRLQVLPLGYASVGIILVFTSVWAYRIRPDTSNALIIGLIVSMLASPLCWMHYTLVLVPFMMTTCWDKTTSVGSLLIWLPQFIPMLSIRDSFMLQASLGGIYTLGMVLIGIGFMRHATVTRFTQSATLSQEEPLLSS